MQSTYSSSVHDLQKKGGNQTKLQERGWRQKMGNRERRHIRMIGMRSSCIYPEKTPKGRGDQESTVTDTAIDLLDSWCPKQDNTSPTVTRKWNPWNTSCVCRCSSAAVNSVTSSSEYQESGIFRYMGASSTIDHHGLSAQIDRFYVKTFLKCI